MDADARKSENGFYRSKQRKQSLFSVASVPSCSTYFKIWGGAAVLRCREAGGGSCAHFGFPGFLGLRLVGRIHTLVVMLREMRVESAGRKDHWGRIQTFDI
jgi:hypothetical protein